MNKDDSNKRIRILLNSTQLSQSDFCKKAGIQKSALSNYLNGDRQPNQGQLSKIAEAFNVSPAWLMGYDVPMDFKTIQDISSLEQQIILAYRVAPDGIKDYINILLNIKKGD